MGEIFLPGHEARDSFNLDFPGKQLIVNVSFVSLIDIGEYLHMEPAKMLSPILCTIPLQPVPKIQLT